MTSQVVAPGGKIGIGITNSFVTRLFILFKENRNEFKTTIYPWVKDIFVFESNINVDDFNNHHWNYKHARNWF